MHYGSLILGFFLYMGSIILIETVLRDGRTFREGEVVSGGQKLKNHIIFLPNRNSASAKSTGHSVRNFWPRRNLKKIFFGTVLYLTIRCRYLMT
jgi:hypothetical protein